MNFLRPLAVIIYLSNLVSGYPFIIFPGQTDQDEFMRKDLEETHESWLHNCTDNDEMPYFNKKEENFECYPLFNQGPCDQDSWLILDKNQPNKTICVEHEYESWLNNCTENDKMPYFNKKEETFECYSLLSPEPCDPGSWLVLDKNQPNKTICAKHCNNVEHNNEENEIDFVNNNEIENEYQDIYHDGTCKSYDQYCLNCPAGQILYTNAFGEGECDCIDGFLPFIEKNKSLSCYQEFLQGPCPQGEQYTFSEKDSEKPSCMPTNCTKPNEIMYENECIPVNTCNDLEYVEFKEIEEGSKNVTKAECQGINNFCINLNLELDIANRITLISGKVRCGAGRRKDAHGKCKKVVGRRRSRNPRRITPITYGPGRTVRDICCG